MKLFQPAVVVINVQTINVTSAPLPNLQAHMPAPDNKADPRSPRGSPRNSELEVEVKTADCWERCRRRFMAS